MKKFNYTLVKYLTMFFPFWISLGRFIPVIDTIVTFAFLYLLITDQSLKKKNIFKYFFILILFFISGIIDSNIKVHLDFVKPIMIILLVFDARDSKLYEYIYEHVKLFSNFLTIQLAIILIINFIFIFIDAGYSMQYTEAWNLKAFQGIYRDPHQCAYHICALIVILTVVARDNNKLLNLLLICGYMYCASITGARVPTVLALYLTGIFIINHVINLYNKKKERINFLKVLTFVIIIFISLILLIKYTTFGQKMVTSLVRDDKSFNINSIDSGRSILRKRHIELFKNEPLINKVFGYGSENLLQYHGSFRNSNKIWSHNDFFQILCGMGMLMFGVYIIYWIKLFKDVSKKSKFMSIFVVLLFAIAFYNGLFIHTRFVFLIPVIFKFLEEKNKIIKDNLLPQHAK